MMKKRDVMWPNMTHEEPEIDSGLCQAAPAARCQPIDWDEEDHQRQRELIAKHGYIPLSEHQMIRRSRFSVVPDKVPLLILSDDRAVFLDGGKAVRVVRRTRTFKMFPRLGLNVWEHEQ